MTLLPGLGIDIMTFTPVARMAEDTFLLWVPRIQGLRTLISFVSAAKLRGSDWIQLIPFRG